MSDKSVSTASFWESKFKNEGAMWKFDPSDSAIETISLFKKKNINEILIEKPGLPENNPQPHILFNRIPIIHCRIPRGA